MKTQADCWEAILEGKTLINNRKEEAWLKDGRAKDKNDNNWYFRQPEIWSIKEEPVMYCRFKKESNGVVSITTPYEVGSKQYKRTLKDGWTECAHKTFEEI